MSDALRLPRPPPPSRSGDLGLDRADVLRRLDWLFCRLTAGFFCFVLASPFARDPPVGASTLPVKAESAAEPRRDGDSPLAPCDRLRREGVELRFDLDLPLSSVDALWFHVRRVRALLLLSSNLRRLQQANSRGMRDATARGAAKPAGICSRGKREGANQCVCSFREAVGRSCRKQLRGSERRGRGDGCPGRGSIRDSKRGRKTEGWELWRGREAEG